MVEFIEYDGKWPNLCSGTLSIKVNDKVYKLERVLVSGGCIRRDDDWNMWTESGPWSLDLDDYPELLPYEKEITDCVNDNVEYGCCGGCI